MATAKKLATQLAGFFVFNPTLGHEDTEGEKILAFYPDADVNLQKDFVGISEALIGFSLSFSKRMPVETLYTEKHRFVFFNCEENHFIGMALKNPPKGQKPATSKQQTYDDTLDNTYDNAVLQGIIRRFYSFFRLFNGPLSRVLALEGSTGVRHRLASLLGYFLPTLELSHLPHLVDAQGFRFLSVDRTAFLTVRYLVSSLSASFPSLRAAAVVHSARLVWSGVAQEDLLRFYDLAQPQYASFPALLAQNAAVRPPWAPEKPRKRVRQYDPETGDELPPPPDVSPAAPVTLVDPAVPLWYGNTATALGAAVPAPLSAAALLLSGITSAAPAEADGFATGPFRLPLSPAAAAAFVAPSAADAAAADAAAAASLAPTPRVYLSNPHASDARGRAVPYPPQAPLTAAQAAAANSVLFGPGPASALSAAAAQQPHEEYLIVYTRGPLTLFLIARPDAATATAASAAAAAAPAAAAPAAGESAVTAETAAAAATADNSDSGADAVVSASATSPRTNSPCSGSRSAVSLALYRRLGAFLSLNLGKLAEVLAAPAAAAAAVSGAAGAGANDAAGAGAGAGAAAGPSAGAGGSAPGSGAGAGADGAGQGTGSAQFLYFNHTNLAIKSTLSATAGRSGDAHAPPGCPLTAPVVRALNSIRQQFAAADRRMGEEAALTRRCRDARETAAVAAAAAAATVASVDVAAGPAGAGADEGKIADADAGAAFTTAAASATSAAAAAAAAKPARTASSEAAAPEQETASGADAPENGESGGSYDQSAQEHGSPRSSTQDSDGDAAEEPQEEEPVQLDPTRETRTDEEILNELLSCVKPLEICIRTRADGWVVGRRATETGREFYVLIDDAACQSLADVQVEVDKLARTFFYNIFIF